MRDMHRFWRRKPRDFSHRVFEVPGAAGRGEPRQIVPIDSPLGTALLRKSFDRLESVAYLQPDRQEAAYGLAFCMTCRIEGLWQPERADQILRNIFHRQPDGPFGVAALNLLAEMYYHHEQGTVAPGEAAAARKNILFAFQNMPQAHRDYEWSRLIELLARLRGRDDVEEGAHLMQLVAELAEQPDAPRQNNLAAHAAGAAQSLVLSARQRPELQKEARDLLARWGVSEQKWLRYYALQSLAFVAERENKHTDAAEYYRQAALLMANDANQHDQHLMQIRSARTMREAGDASAALAMIQSFQPHNRAPAALLNGYYGVELGKCLEAVGRKEEALETYVAYAEACANLVDNSDVVQRITALGGAPLNPEREIDVRYI
jgi:hypothetical protein